MFIIEVVNLFSQSILFRKENGFMKFEFKNTYKLKIWIIDISDRIQYNNLSIIIDIVFKRVF